MFTKDQILRLVSVSCAVVVVAAVALLVFLPTSRAPDNGSRNGVASNTGAPSSYDRGMADMTGSIPDRGADDRDGMSASVTESPVTGTGETDVSSVPSDLAGDDREAALADLPPASAPVVQPVVVMDDAQARTAALLQKEGIELLTAEGLHDKMEYDWHGVVIDVGAKNSFLGSHIIGSINIPENRVAELAPIVLPDKHTTIVVYCGSRNCTASLAAARAFRSAGYTDVYEFWGGLKDWVAMGFPTTGIEVAGK